MVRRVEGYIEEVNPQKMQARVKIPQANDLITDWLQIGFTGPDEQFSYRAGDYVGMLLDDSFEDGWIVCRLYDEDAELGDEKVYKRIFRDGSEIKYDEDATTMTVKIGQNEIVVKPNKIEISAAGEGQATFKPIHDKSPCPMFGACHLTPSITIAISG